MGLECSQHQGVLHIHLAFEHENRLIRVADNINVYLNRGLSTVSSPSDFHVQMTAAHDVAVEMVLDACWVSQSQRSLELKKYSPPMGFGSGPHVLQES